MIVFADLGAAEERLRYTATATAASKYLTQDMGLGGPGLTLLSLSKFNVKGPFAVMVFYSTYARTVSVLVELFKETRFAAWELSDKCAFQPDFPAEAELGYEPGTILIEKRTFSESRLLFPSTKVTFYQRAR